MRRLLRSQGNLKYWNEGSRKSKKAAGSHESAALYCLFTILYQRRCRGLTQYVLNRLTAVQDALNQTTSYAYNKLGLLQSGVLMGRSRFEGR